MLEEERKYEAGPGFAVPDLTPCLPSGGQVVELPPATLKATYFDTADLRLARAGVSLRYRRGDPAPWTVKLPAQVPGVRREISRRAAPGTVPPELAALVTVWHRGAPLAPAAVVRTVRRGYELRDGSGGVLAEVADDTVSVLDGRRTKLRFREIEVERRGCDREQLDRVEAALRAAGATGGGFTPKHVRALGPAASAPPELPPPPRLRRRRASAGEAITAVLRTDVARILNQDPLVRLGQPANASNDNDGDRVGSGGDGTPVHRMRAGCRRLRSDLRTFAPLLDQAWADRLRDELAWLDGVLGAARDAEVLRARLRRTAAADPLAPLDEVAVARLDADLAARHEDALAELEKALAAKRYRSLVDDLVAAAQAPSLTPAAERPAGELLPRLAAQPWRRLAYGSQGIGGAADLDAAAPDEHWHAVRTTGRHARYAVEAAAVVAGAPATALGAALARVQDLLGEHRDAAVAAQAWLSIARSDPDDHLLAVTAGRLVERERAQMRRVRAGFTKAWRAATRPRLTAWLP
ncbi:MAG TPA: CYTH and CHAD domain-containing protein [Micromonosporaceae bacterium]|nr:CYTH and CHAD domain-containing protein [Micromonosporaceae bacterium]